MKNLKVVRFLSVLTAFELNEFGKYLRSPYFNSHQGTIDLYDFLKDFHPEFPQASIQKEKVFSHLYPDSSYDEKKVYDLGKYLHRLLLQFLSMQQMQKHQELWEPVMLISALEEHKLYKELPKVFASTEKQFAKSSHQDSTYFYYQYIFTEQSCNQVLHAYNRSAEAPLQSIADQLDYFILISKLEIAIPFANKRSILEGEENSSLIKETIEFYEKMVLPKPKTIQLFYCILRMLTDEDGSAFFEQTKQLLPACTEILPELQLYRSYLYVINFCSKMIKRGYSNYLEETFQLYKQMLDKDLLFIYPTATNINFKNVVTISIRLEKYSWVKNFIKNNESRIGPESKTSIISYSLACLHFAKKEYSEAKRQLSEMKFIDPFYRLSNDILLLKVYYETGDTDILYFRCRAFTTYIQRNKTLAEANKTAYSNLAKFIRRLAKVKFDNKNVLAKIKKDFSTCEYLVERSWLEEKIEELNGRR